jgi:RNAse (barnase) inhibitor barstar
MPQSLGKSQIIEFCEKHSIAWFPIYLNVYQNPDGSWNKDLMKITHISYSNKKPKQTDFNTLTIEEIKSRQDILKIEKFKNICEHIAIDTSKMFHIDIDIADYDEGYDKIAELAPWFASTTKSYGKHIFIRDESFVPTSKRIQLKNGEIGGVELLCGQWSYCPIDVVVNNSEKDVLKFINLNEIIISKTKKQIEIPIAEPIVENTEPIVQDSTDDDLKFVNMCLSEGLFKEQSIKYDDWIKFGFALKNRFNNDGYVLFDKFSQMCSEKYNKSNVKKFWDCLHDTNKKPITIKYIYKLAKTENSKLFKEILMKTKTDTNNYADNDNECADIILKALEGQLIFTKSQLFIKKNNVWLNGIGKVRDYLHELIMNFPVFKFVGETAVKKWADYHPAMNVVNTIICKIKNKPQDEIYMKFHTTTKNRICFLDGVLDCSNKKFYTWEEIDFEYFSVVQIQRPFKSYFDNPDKELKNTIMKDILKPLFGDKTELFLELFARAITGNYQDKNWMSYVGNRDCGKGVLFALLKSFEGYINEFGTDNILCGRENVKPITPKELYWLLDLEFVRFAMPQETPSEGFKINSKMIKSVCSGGDSLKARRNYDTHDTDFILECFIAIFGNHHLDCTDKDADERRFPITNVIQFKSKEEIEQMKTANILPIDVINKTYFLKDDTIKDKASSVEYKNAFVMLVLDYLKDKAPINIKSKDEEDDTLLVEIYKNLNITNSQEDIVIASDLKSLFKFPMPKVIIELKALGIQYKKNRNRDDPDKRDKMCFYGIKIKE